jgi:hypothetical protein
MSKISHVIVEGDSSIELKSCITNEDNKIVVDHTLLIDNKKRNKHYLYREAYDFSDEYVSLDEHQKIIDSGIIMTKNMKDLIVEKCKLKSLNLRLQN